MGSRKLEDWIDGFVYYVRNTEPPESFKRWTAISTIAACMRRKCRLQWGLETIYPNMYIVLVGPSGCRKGTAMGPAEKMLRTIGVATSPESVTREQLIRRLEKAGETSTKASMGGSIEVGSVIPHSSLTIFSKELTVFLGYNNQQLMADLCDWFDCGDEWSYETKGSGRNNIENIWVNLIGATTPSLLQSTLPQDAIGGGLTSRMIFVYESRKGKNVALPFIDAEDVMLGEKLIQDLSEISMMQGEFRPTQDFLDAYEEWYQIAEETSIKDPRFEGYVSRRSVHLRKLCMIMSASRSDNAELIVDKADFDRALAELKSVERKMDYAFTGVGQSDLIRVTSAVMRTVAMKGEISFGELLGLHVHDVDGETLKKVVSTLVSIRHKGGKVLYTARLDTNTNETIIKYVGGKDEES